MAGDQPTMLAPGFSTPALGLTAIDFLESIAPDGRTYRTHWPTAFTSARGSWLTDTVGATYLDFFTAAGALNYGHHNSVLKEALSDHLTSPGPVTEAMAHFRAVFDEYVLQPRGLTYDIRFPGTQATDALDDALTLVRQLTGRESVLTFTSAFHGLPWNTETFEQALGGSRSARPAAVIVEAVHSAGEAEIWRTKWLRELAGICKARDVLLIVDDVELGCGRTGPFFSFETAKIEPDLVILSKAVSGYGLPMSLTLIKPTLTAALPRANREARHGSNPALVTGRAAIEEFWSDRVLETSTMSRGRSVRLALDSVANRHDGLAVHGRGFVQSLVFDVPQNAARVSQIAFRNGLLVGTAGARGEVVKIRPPLTITYDDLAHGLGILTEAVDAAIG